MSVFIATPTSDIKNYCFDRWIAAVNRLTYIDRDLFIADNSTGDENFQNLHKESCYVVRVKPLKKENSIVTLTRSQNTLRDIFIGGTWKYFFSLESDIMPPPGILEYLVSYDLPVLSVPYFLRTDAQAHLSMQMIATGTEKTVHINANPAVSFGQFKGKVMRYDQYGYSGWHLLGGGIGCTLIRRDVMERIKFRCDGRGAMAGVFSDTFFYQDCYKSGIPMYLDTNIIVEHDNQTSWHENINYRRHY